jgi:hypothetical protein
MENRKLILKIIIKAVLGGLFAFSLIRIALL